MVLRTLLYIIDAQNYQLFFTLSIGCYHLLIIFLIV